MDLQKVIESLLEKIAQLEARIKTLEVENALLRNKKNSSNSHLPPSQDIARPKRNQSLRERTDKKVGGQPGHKGTTLECSSEVDEIIKHMPSSCSNCGNELCDAPEVFLSARQLVDIPPIAFTRIEHQLYQKQCSCGHTMQGDFPKHVASAVQYGPNVETLVSYLHARQYMPYGRMQEFLKDIMGLPISTGGIANILQRMANKATPFYNEIKEKIAQATCIGADETGVKIDGKNHWAWVWQNDTHTYILCAQSRGFKTIEEVFSKGLPGAIVVHDRWASHFQMDAKGHQICCAHLLRDLNYLNELYEYKCIWAKQFKILLQDAIQLKKEFTEVDYLSPNKKRNTLGNKLKRLLNFSIPEEHAKSKTLQKSLSTKSECILHFLLHQNVPPDNNGSERAIRNIKVKLKISGQFKTLESANVFAILRSVIDTTIKAGNNVLNSLYQIATFEY